MMNKSLLVLSLLSVGLTANTASQADERKLISASFYPLAFMAEQIMGDKAQVIDMARSVGAHDYEPSPQDLVKLERSDLVVFLGAGMESWTDGVIPELTEKGIVSVEVSHGLDLFEKEKKHHDDEAEHHDEKKDDHGDEDKHGDEEHHEDERGEEDERGHKHGKFDPHTWLDPILAQQMVDNVLEAIVAVDGANEAFYTTNAEALNIRFAQLDLDYQTGLANCDTAAVIVSHNAYGYLARRYGFKTHAISGLSPHDEPSAKNLAELKKEAEAGLTHILIEDNNVRRFADTLMRETGLASVPANPLGRGTLDPEKDFFDIMEMNLESFKKGLACK